MAKINSTQERARKFLRFLQVGSINSSRYTDFLMVGLGRKASGNSREQRDGRGTEPAATQPGRRIGKGPACHAKGNAGYIP
jgi:hypothetical protein